MSRTQTRQAWIAGLATLLVAGFASADDVSGAQVVKVRVGNHPTYTRVVFELDASAGYRIEKGRAGDGASEIRITLEAAARPISVDRKTVMVERVALEQGAAQSVAHIRLQKEPSRVKEMILANPPRIVFDLVFPESQLAAIRRAEQRKAAKAAAQQEAKSATTAAAEAPPVVPKPEPRPVAKVEKPRPEPAPVAKVERPRPEPTPVARVEKPRPEPVQVAKVEEPQSRPAAAPAVKPEPAVKPVEPEGPKPTLAKPEAAKPTPLAKPQPEASAPHAARTQPAPPKPSMRPPAAPSGGIDWVLWGSVAAGGLLLTMLVVLVLRRRSLPNDMDVTAVAEEQAAEGGLPADGFSMDGPLDAPTVAENSTFGASAPDVESRSAEVDIAAGPGLFDEEDPEKENESMDLENSGMEQSASEMPTQLGGGAGDADVTRVVRELERRVAQMEARLDEAGEARERLERQVAAQAEELRVQRAAIARTQRAMRSLNRPAEEQATEPALREPAS